MKLNKFEYRFFSFVLIFSLFFNFFVPTVYAVDLSPSEIEEFYDALGENKRGFAQKAIQNIWLYIISQTGALSSGDMANLIANDDTLKEQFSSDATVTRATNPKTGEEEDAILVPSTVTQSLINNLNVYSQENQSYVLLPTVKFSYVKPSYFYNTTLYNAAKEAVDKYGVVSICRNDVSPESIYIGDLSSLVNSYYAVGSKSSTSLTVDDVNYTFDTRHISFFENMSTCVDIGTYTFYYNGNVDDIAYRGLKTFYLDGYFRYQLAYLKKNNSSYYYKRAFISHTIVSSTGFSLPVFSTVADAVDYQMDKGLYYTSSDYTGVGQDIYIYASDLDTINNSDYSKLYDYTVNNVSNAITNNNGNNITYNELTNIVDNTYVNMDEILGALDNIDDSINNDTAVTSSLLSQILSSLNDFKNSFVSHSTVLSNISNKLDDILDVLKSIRNWTIADTITDVADMLADWADFIADLINDVGSGIAVIADSVKDVADTMTTKFPFSIPWDMAFLISFLAETPKVPVFEVPFNFPTYGIEYTFVFDMTRFSAISKISRLLLTIIFSIGLLKLTNNIVSTKKR